MQHFWKKTRENTFWFLEYAKFDVSPDNVFFKMSHIQIVKYRKVSVSIQACFNSVVQSRKWRYLYSKFDTRPSKIQKYVRTLIWRVFKYPRDSINSDSELEHFHLYSRIVHVCGKITKMAPSTFKIRQLAKSSL